MALHCQGLKTDIHLQKTKSSRALMKTSILSLVILNLLATCSFANNANAQTSLFIPMARGSCTALRTILNTALISHGLPYSYVDDYINQQYPFFSRCSDERVGICLATEAHKGADGLYTFTRCFNREMAFVFASSPSRSAKVTEQQFLESITSNYNPSSYWDKCVFRVWILDRQPWATAKRACSFQ